MNKSIEIVGLVKQVYALGASLRVRDGKVQMQGIEYLPSELIHTLRTHKEEVRNFLEANIFRKEDGRRRDVPIPPISRQGEISIHEKLCPTNPVLEKVRGFLRECPSSWLELRKEEDKDYSWMVPKPFQGSQEYKEWFWLYVVSDAAEESLWQLPASRDVALRFGKLTEEWTGLSLKENVNGYEQISCHTPDLLVEANQNGPFFVGSDTDGPMLEPQTKEGARELSGREISILQQGLEALKERMWEEISTSERDIEDLKERIASNPAAQYTRLIPKAKMAEGGLEYITKGEYEKLTGHLPHPSILTRDGKRVRPEYALDELASQLGYEERAVHESKSGDDLLRGDIMSAAKDRVKLSATRQRIRNEREELNIAGKLKEMLEYRREKYISYY